MAITRTEREKYLLSLLPSRRHILKAAYQVAAKLPANSVLRPGMPATEMIQVILDREFPGAAQAGGRQDRNVVLVRPQGRRLTNATWLERKRVLTALRLENPRALHAEFATAMDTPPAAWLTDREMVGEILRREVLQQSIPSKFG